MSRSSILRPLLAITLVAACGASAGGSGPAAVPTSASPEAPASASPSHPGAVASAGPGVPETALGERLEAEIPVPGSPDFPLAAFDSIWVLAPDLPLHVDGEKPYLVRIDPATNEVLASIEVPDRLCQGFTASDDAIWLCAADALVRIDPATNTVSGSVPVKGAQLAYRPAFGGGMVWALGSDGMVGDTVLRLDPTTEEVVSFSASAAAAAMAYGFDALWLALPNDGTIARLDPATGEISVVASGLSGPRAIAIGRDSLWVALHGGGEDQAAAGDTQVIRIDPTSGNVLAEFEIGGSPQWGVDLWAADSGILVRSTDPWLVRIDEATNEIVETITSDSAVQGPVTQAFGSIWTVELERDVVYRISP